MDILEAVVRECGHLCLTSHGGLLKTDYVCCRCVGADVKHLVAFYSCNCSANLRAGKGGHKK